MFVLLHLIPDLFFTPGIQLTICFDIYVLRIMSDAILRMLTRDHKLPSSDMIDTACKYVKHLRVCKFKRFDWFRLAPSKR